MRRGNARAMKLIQHRKLARTGHTVLTTIHSNSCEATYRRMCTLCKRKYDIKDETLMALVTEAFPIIVFTKNNWRTNREKLWKSWNVKFFRMEL